MSHYFRIYYLVTKKEILAKFKERFNTTVSVNGESHIYTDDKGKELLLESEKRGYITIRKHDTI